MHTREEVVQCKRCGLSWRPNNFGEGSWARGHLENLEVKEPIEACVKHSVKNCEECEKERLYAE